ncbi:hypothetical protein P168DRAFT_290664 [Aspergillus campestris IBT 28561]|uniref:ERCC4 domain-containing protein n=1 Tax=Aspergillus campestris (strain IBT 28561) TaxID=1392248 RepID=A0A2I1D0U2_ASPC2|nr:uncharacterized protein P168DRAFT_290664 [Aspergillus campestris IBT 28561]PKY03495.1 hypothetical protein P168DRAFT_290664 [Aspergillus campestris IBT 28561]
MPDVIDLVSSSPRPLPPPPPTSATTVNQAHHEPASNPSKRRRLSPDAQDPFVLFSDEDVLPSRPAPMQTYPGDLTSDPITFTSSAPPIPPDTITIDDDDDIDEFSDPFAVPDPADLWNLATTATTAAPEMISRPRPQFSSRTENLLASLHNRSQSNGVNDDDYDAPKPRSRPTSTGSQPKIHPPRKDGEDRDLLDDPPSPRPAPRKTASKRTTADKDARAREREATKAQREHDRQVEKERKQRLKEEKAREKQRTADLAAVNKLKIDKKESLPEMIVDLATTLQETSVGNQTAEFMTRLGVEQTFFASAIPNVVRWRRKVRAQYNPRLGYWEPCVPHVQDEAHVLVLLTAQEFVNLATATPSTHPSESSHPVDLQTHVHNLRTAYPNCSPIYLIEGLKAWFRKNQTARNRAFQAAQPDPISDDVVEDALLALQVTHTCLIHHSGTPAESATWIKTFTEHVSTVPYRRERMNGQDAAFCMDTGQVKSGDNKSDTFIKMLQEVNRITASMAYGIAERYPSVMDLVGGMRREGVSTLEDVKKSANKNGALTNARIGPAASKRLYKVFMGTDPTATGV